MQFTEEEKSILLQLINKATFPGEFSEQVSTLKDKVKALNSASDEFKIETPEVGNE